MTDFPGGLTLEGLKRRLDKEKTNDDDLLADYLLAAFEQAKAPAPFGCGRHLDPSPAFQNTGNETEPVWEDTAADPVTEELDARGQRRVLVPDAREITAVTFDGTVTTDYKVERRDGVIVAIRFGPSVAPYDGGYYGYVYSDPRPWQERAPQTVTVTGRFGFAWPLPENLKDAIYVLAARSYNERAANYADQVQVGEGAKADVYYRQLPLRTKLVFASLALPAAYAGLK